ncbi:Octanoyltransferase [Alphaproteobacteria bacterium]
MQSYYFMQQQVDAIIEKKESPLLWFLEHDHMYTAGYNTLASDLLGAQSLLPLYTTDRGGKLTYHGPGQRVIYLLLNLHFLQTKVDVKLFILNIQKWLIASLAHFSIKGVIYPGKIGVWVFHCGADKKIASIGLKLRRFVTSHGIALNVNTDLSYFDKIIACGMKDNVATSMQEILETDISMKEVDSVLLGEFVKIFGI